MDEKWKKHMFTSSWCYLCTLVRSPRFMYQFMMVRIKIQYQEKLLQTVLWGFILPGCIAAISWLCCDHKENIWLHTQGSFTVMLCTTVMFSCVHVLNNISAHTVLNDCIMLDCSRNFLQQWWNFEETRGAHACSLWGKACSSLSYIDTLGNLGHLLGNEIWQCRIRRKI